MTLFMHEKTRNHGSGFIVRVYLGYFRASSLALAVVYLSFMFNMA
jgi:hypothetical protein